MIRCGSKPSAKTRYGEDVVVDSIHGIALFVQAVIIGIDSIWDVVILLGIIGAVGKLFGDALGFGGQPKADQRKSPYDRY